MFEELIGNDRVKTSLARLVEKDRIPHSLLFVGQNGLGKKRFAIEISKAFVCQKMNGYTPCGSCSACTRVTKFVFPTSGEKKDYEKVFFSEHPDIGMVISNKQTIYIGAIRKLELEANYRPYESKARVFIINEAEKMTPQASNALLKTLEEPAKTTYIFLISSRPTSLLSTIRSRCQTIRFAPIGKSEIESLLFNRHNYSSEDAKLVANLSGGSIGTALSIDLENYRESRKKMGEVLECIINRRGYSVLLKKAEEMNEAKDRDEYEKHLEILLSLIRDLFLLGPGLESSNIVNTDIMSALRDLSKKAQTAKLLSWINEIEKLRRNLSFNLNRKIAADALFMKLK